MSHRKVRSLGNVPFSWEKEPGVSKVNHQKCPTDIGLYTLDLPLPPPTPPPPPCHSSSPKQVPVHGKKIPLPPCPSKPPSRSTSLKSLWRQEDPFLAAYKECTKSTRIGKMSAGESKRVVGSNVRKSKFIFSCKEESCNVRDDNLVRLTHLPPLPRERTRAGGLR